MPRQQQLQLPLGQVDVPEHLLRAAWQRSRLKQSFEEAMNIRHLSISLKHAAIALGKIGKGGNKCRRAR